MKRTMRIAKADDEDFETLRNFLHACENLMSRQKFSLCSAEEQWLDWDEDDADKIELTRIRKRISKEEHLSEDDVDNRLIIYEFLQRRFLKCGSGWHRVTMAADCLIKSVCDPMEDHLSFYPGIEMYHVSPEQ